MGNVTWLWISTQWLFQRFGMDFKLLHDFFKDLVCTSKTVQQGLFQRFKRLQDFNFKSENPFANVKTSFLILTRMCLNLTSLFFYALTLITSSRLRLWHTYFSPLNYILLSPNNWLHAQKSRFQLSPLFLNFTCYSLCCPCFGWVHISLLMYSHCHNFHPIRHT